ncbi:MAG: DUF1292 domain-containing protein [Lachnospiraceae bacterium]|nr:DUF1292 domain-containing protein [Lachnospiraceae bacterium]MDE6742668.1 DUF1292 domain-containing protein [Lachnospiraceae bacterium]
MEKITLIPEEGELPVEFYVLEETTVGGRDYFLVTDAEDGDGEALILKDMSEKEDAEALFVIVSDDDELDAVAGIFAGLMEDISLQKDEGNQ